MINKKWHANGPANKHHNDTETRKLMGEYGCVCLWLTSGCAVLIKRGHVEMRKDEESSKKKHL